MTTTHQKQYAEWLEGMNYNYTATIRSIYPLTQAKIDRYSNTLLKLNPNIENIYSVIEPDTDPYSKAQDNNDESLRHLCIVKNNYLSESEKSISYVLRFNEHLTFDITSDRVKLNELALEEWIEDAKKMKEEDMPYREISDELFKKGFTVSKSTLQRKLK